MNFNKLQEQEKELMSEKLNKFCELFGGANAFLQVIETIKDEKPHPLLNKTSIYHTQLAKLSWSKSLFKETLNKIFDCIKHEDKEGDIFANLSPKEYKGVMNVIRTIKPIELTIINKKASEDEGIVFKILDTSIEKNTKFTMEFKMLFFYDIPTLKTILSYNK